MLLVIPLIFTYCGKKKISENDNSSESYDLDFAKLRSDFISKYAESEELDTLIVDSSGDSISLKYRYYCSFDSALTIPEKFVWEEDKKDFITHNFLTSYQVIVNSDTVLNRTISKEDFVSVLSPELIDYAVFFSHNFRGFSIEKSALEFGYSITIPVTDIGQGKTLWIKKDGSFEVE